MKLLRGYRCVVSLIFLLEFVVAEVALEGEQTISVWCDEAVLNLIVSKLNEINTKVDLLGVQMANVNTNDKTSPNIRQMVVDAVKEYHIQPTLDSVGTTLKEMRETQLAQQLSIVAQLAAVNRTLHAEIMNQTNAQTSKATKSTEIAIETNSRLEIVTNLLNENQQQLNKLDRQIEQGFVCLKNTNPTENYLQHLNRTNELIQFQQSKNAADNKQIISLLYGNNDEMKTVETQIRQGFEENRRQFNSLQTSKALIQNKITNLADGINTIEAKISPFPDCETATKITAQNGVYQLYVPYSGITPFKAYCFYTADGSGSWTTIQRRISGKESFYREWDSYRNGFGDPNENYWLGLEKIYALTSRKKHELYIDLVDHEGKRKHARYSNFKIGPEAEKYYLKSVGVYSGDAGDSLGSANKTRRFTTFDADNDEDNTRNCATTYLGAWWFNNCDWSSLNGEYNNILNGRGINWNTWHGFEYSLKSVYMAIRATE